MFGIDDAALGGILGGLGQAAGGIGGLFGGSKGTDWTSIQLMREQQQMQKEFAQNGIRWKVADAKAAGLHPLAAIGAAGASYSPVSYAGSTSGGGSDLGQSLKDMGQGLGRAVASTQTKEERVASAFELTRQRQEIERGDLINAKLASDLALQQSQLGPGMPSNMANPAHSIASAKGYIVKDAEVTATGDPGKTAAPPGGVPLATEYSDPYGGRTPLPQKDVNIDEFSSPGWGSYFYTNRLLPMVDQALGRDSPAAPPKSSLPPGAVSWHFAFPGRWIPVYPPMSRKGHLSFEQKYGGPRASTYPYSRSGAERY